MQALYHRIVSSRQEAVGSKVFHCLPPPAYCQLKEGGRISATKGLTRPPRVLEGPEALRSPNHCVARGPLSQDLCGIEMSRGRCDEFDSGREFAGLAAIDPDHAGRHHLATICQHAAARAK